MTAAVLHGPADLRIEHRPVPAALPGWVVVAVEAAGICGTDVAVYRGTHAARVPVVLGHEFAGRVAQVGPGVEGLQRGQPVAGEGGWNCGACAACTGGRPERCRARALLGRTVDGCFAEHVAMPASALYPLGDALPARTAQAMTALATAIHAADRAGDLAGRQVAIVGPGHAGLLLLQVIRLRGARHVTMIGTRASRLALATRLGADEVVTVEAFAAWAADPAHQEFDIVFEASGTARGLTEAVQIAAPGGTVVAYGIIAGTLEGVPGRELYDRELSIVGSKGAGNRYAHAVELLAAGAVNADLLVTHTLPLLAASQGFALMLDRASDAVRVILRPGRDRLESRE